MFILFLSAMMEVAFPDNSRFYSEIGVKLEIVGGDITDVRRFQRPILIRIFDCIYADDAALVSDSFEYMQEIICQLAQTATKFGLLPNLQKTVSMRFNPAVQENLTVPRPFYVGNHPLKDVSSFPYLGSILTPDKGATNQAARECSQYRLARYMLAAKLMDHVQMMRAYEELGMIPLRVLLVRHNLAWGARIINYNESRLPWLVMHSQMACGRRQRGHPHQRWSDTLKAALAFADLPTYREWSLSITVIGDNWKE